MATSGRVRADEFSDAVEFFPMPSPASDFAVDLCGRAWRIYEAVDDYSSTSGGIRKKGKVIRRFDPEAGDAEGKIAEFKSAADALAYVEKYLVTPADRARLAARPSAFKLSLSRSRTVGKEGSPAAC